LVWIGLRLVSAIQYSTILFSCPYTLSYGLVWFILAWFGLVWFSFG
jgi:hypothetical protein